MDKLEELEKDSHELLSTVRANADAQDLEMSLPALDIEDCRSGMMRRRIPSWVAVAAMVVGIAIGFMLSGHEAQGEVRQSAFNYADTCCSIAQNDVNLALLVTSL